MCASSASAPLSTTDARPLVMRCGAFGDMVLLTPLVRALHERFGAPVDIVSSGGWTRALLEGQPGVGNLYLIKSRKTPYWLSSDQRQLVRALRARGPGPAWYCDTGAGRDLLSRAGIGADLVCDARDLEWIAREHFVERWARFARCTPLALARSTLAASALATPAAPSASLESAAAGVMLGPLPRARLEILPHMRSACAAWRLRHGLVGRPVIAIQAGNKRTMRIGPRRRVSNSKYWPEERWASLIELLRAAEPKHAILLLGVPAEHAMNAEIRALTRASDVHNVADDLPIDVLLPLLAECDSLVSVDTGPAHAAAALDCPTVALFGLSDTDLYRPGGIDTPAIALTGEIDGRPDILGIGVESVFVAWRRLTHRI